MSALRAAWENDADAARWAPDGSHQLRPAPASAANGVWWCAECRQTHHVGGDDADCRLERRTS